MPKFYIDGVEVSRSQAIAYLRGACAAAGVMLEDITPNFDATAATDWGREMLNEVSGYSLEIIGGETAIY